MLAKTGKIDGKMVDVITPEQYYSNPSLYSYNYSAIDGDNGIIYPIRSKMDSRPGVYMSPNSALMKFKNPAEEEIADYSSSNIIDLSDNKTMSEVIHKKNLLTDQERTILTTVDNIFKPPIKPDDSSEMVGMKEALQAKNCDIDKYEHRFGRKNFQNEKRLFDRSTMTLSKIRSTCNALDIKCTMILEDTTPNVPNPMGKKIVIDITGGNAVEGEDNDE